MSELTEATKVLEEHAPTTSGKAPVECRPQCGWTGNDFIQHRAHVAKELCAVLFPEDALGGCDCAELCSMGPTCPGGMLARLPGSGCSRTLIVRAVEQERDALVEENERLRLRSWIRGAVEATELLKERQRAEAAEQRVVELEAAVLALADEWDAHSDRMHDEAIGADRDAAIVLRSKSGTYAVNAERLSALVSDPTALDRIRQEAVEAALAPIEALATQKVAEANGPNPFLLVTELARALAAARDAAKEAGR